MYPIEKYRFFTHGRRVIAVSTYAGKNVRGVAACDPRDEFSLEKGKELAAARCASKIAAKRVKRAETKMAEAMDQKAAAIVYVNRMREYLGDSWVELEEANERLAQLETEM